MVVTRAAALVRGSIALIALRGVLLVVAGLPMIAQMAISIGDGAARRPYFTDVHGRLPIYHLLRFFDQLPSLGAPLGAAALLALLGEQVLVAGALAWLDPRADRSRGGAVGSALRAGFGWLGPMLRVMVCAALLSAGGALAIHWLVNRIEVHGDAAGWSGRTLVLVLPLVQGIATLSWMALIGAWAFWCRVVLVADGSRRALAASRRALRVFRAAVLQGPLFFMGVTLVSFIGSAAVLVVWRQFPPRTVGGVALVLALWLATLLAQAWLWHWLVRAAHLLYAEPRFTAMRSKPLVSLELFARLRRLARFAPSR